MGTATNPQKPTTAVDDPCQKPGTLFDACYIAELANNASIDRMMALNANHEVILWNKSNELATGLKKEAVMGKKFFELFPEAADCEEIKKGIACAFAGFTYFVPAGWGSYEGGYYENHFTPLRDENDCVIGVLNIKHDVAHRIHTESELKALNASLAAKNRQLQHRNAELLSISNITSHDLKEPLRKIYIFVELLRSRERELLSDTAKLYFGRIQSAVQRLNVLIADMVVYSQLKIDDDELSPADLNEVLETAWQSLEQTINAKKAIVSFEKLPTVNGSYPLLVHLFQCILANALKFQDSGNIPRIHVSVKSMKGPLTGHPDALPDADYTEISFTDNGIGFEQQYAHKIFQIFQRLHSADHFTGSGMGLAIAQKIAELHQGFIIATSAPEKGSVFRCFFPLPTPTRW